jgi:hypothetical protein
MKFLVVNRDAENGHRRNMANAEQIFIARP